MILCCSSLFVFSKLFADFLHVDFEFCHLCIHFIIERVPSSPRQSELDTDGFGYTMIINNKQTLRFRHLWRCYQDRSDWRLIEVRLDVFQHPSEIGRPDGPTDSHHVGEYIRSIRRRRCVSLNSYLLDTSCRLLSLLCISYVSVANKSFPYRFEPDVHERIEHGSGRGDDQQRLRRLVVRRPVHSKRLRISGLYQNDVSKPYFLFV